MNKIYFVRKMGSVNEDIQGPAKPQREKEWDRYKDLGMVEWKLTNGQPVSGFAVGKRLDRLAVQVNDNYHLVLRSSKKVQYCQMGWCYMQWSVEKKEKGMMKDLDDIRRKVILLPRLDEDGTMTDKEKSFHCVVDMEWLRMDENGKFVPY